MKSKARSPSVNAVASLTARSPSELAADPSKQSTRRVACASAAPRRPVERDGAPLIDGPGQQGRFVIGERTLSPIMPDGASDVVEYVGRGDGVDDARRTSFQ